MAKTGSQKFWWMVLAGLAVAGEESCFLVFSAQIKLWDSHDKNGLFGQSSEQLLQSIVLAGIKYRQ